MWVGGTPFNDETFNTSIFLDKHFFVLLHCNKEILVEKIYYQNLITKFLE